MPTRKKSGANIAHSPKQTRRRQSVGTTTLSVPNEPNRAAMPPAVVSGTASSSVHHSTGLLRIVTWPLRWFWQIKWGLAFLSILAISLLLLPSESARTSTESFRYDANQFQLSSVPKRDTALVLGAGVLPDHTPTSYLKNRIETAVSLYKAGRVSSLIMSGDNSASHYNEPNVMKAYAVRLGVPAEDIVLDVAGYNTYDSCSRAKNIFQQSSLTVVTQGYHLPRAVLTCREQGIDAIGLAAKHTGRDWTVAYIIREHLSTAKAFAQNILKPQLTALGHTENMTH